MYRLLLGHWCNDVVFGWCKIYWFINILPFNNSIKRKNTKIINNGAVLIKCKIRSRGNNNIILHNGAIIRNTVINIKGNNNVVEIGPNATVNCGNIFIEDDNNNVIIGEGTNICGSTHLACIEGTSIRIGKECLFSSEIVFRTGDSHSILDESGNRINPSKDIVVGDRVWIGYRAMLNKGAVISKNSVVGTGAVVTKSFEEEIIILAGVPAKIVKRNIDWIKERI
jgi:acetyltransferase-like isoleucine patch superfamily enzyme